MADQDSDCSFLDHGQEAELAEAMQPEWNLEKTPHDTFDDDDDDDDSDNSDGTVGDDGGQSCEGSSSGLNRDVRQLQAAMRKATVHSDRILQTNRSLQGENRTLKKANAVLVDCNRSLTQQSNALACAVVSLSKKQEEMQLAVVDMAKRVQEIEAAVRSLVNRSLNS